MSFVPSKAAVSTVQLDSLHFQYKREQLYKSFNYNQRCSRGTFWPQTQTHTRASTTASFLPQESLMAKTK